MPQPDNQNCENCRFFDDNYKDISPRCHRYPPQAQDETELGAPLYIRSLNCMFGDSLKSIKAIGAENGNRTNPLW